VRSHDAELPEEQREVLPEEQREVRAIAAAQWFRKDAKQGHTRAQHDLGELYNLRESVRNNPKAAARWLRWATEQGHARAQVFFADSLCAHQDTKTGTEWYRKAADQGYVLALYSLGRGSPVLNAGYHLEGLSFSATLADMTIAIGV